MQNPRLTLFLVNLVLMLLAAFAVEFLFEGRISHGMKVFVIAVAAGLISAATSVYFRKASRG